MAQHGEMRIYILEVEVKMDASQNLKGKECLVLTWLRVSYLHGLKVPQNSSSNSVKHGEENQAKTRWVWSGKQNMGSFIPIFHDFSVFLQIFSKL